MELQNTKGMFQIRGIISDLKTDKKYFGFESGVIKKGVSEGAKFNKLKFYVQTSKTNKIPIELFGMEKEKVCFYSKDKKDTQMVAWGLRNTYKAEGYELIVPEYDLAQYIHDTFKDGESVFINGEFQFTEYENKQNQTVNQIKYMIKSIYYTTTILKVESFDEENFDEYNSFQQEVIINNVYEDIKEKKIYLNCFVIDYKGLHNTMLLIDSTKTSVQMQRSFKSLKLGDFLKVNGIINHQVQKIEIDGEWGKDVILNINKSLEVVGAVNTSLSRKLYTEEQLTTPVLRKDTDLLVDEKELGFSLSN